MRTTFNRHHKRRGFTLIELVMVIVVLGILAAVALPKFVDLSGEAKAARAKSLAGASSSASAVNYTAIQLANQPGSSPSVNIPPFRAGQGTVALDADVSRIIEGWSDGGDPKGDLYLQDTIGCDANHASIPIKDIRSMQTLATAEVYCSN